MALAAPRCAYTVSHNFQSLLHVFAGAMYEAWAIMGQALKRLSGKIITEIFRPFFNQSLSNFNLRLTELAQPWKKHSQVPDQSDFR